MYNEFDKEEFIMDEEEMGDPKANSLDDEDEDELDGDKIDEEEVEDEDLDEDENPLAPGDEEEEGI